MIAIVAMLAVYAGALDTFESQISVTITESYWRYDIRIAAEHIVSELRALTWEALNCADSQVPETVAEVTLYGVFFDTPKLIRLELVPQEGGFTKWTSDLHDVIEASCKKGTEELQSVLKETVRAIHVDEA